jgi:hypothetical protein
LLEGFEKKRFQGYCYEFPGFLGSEKASVLDLSGPKKEEVHDDSTA